MRGIDVSRRMLSVARTRLAEAEAREPGVFDDRLTFVERALEDCALRDQGYEDDGSYDVVVAGLVLHYVRDLGPVLRQVARWLKPGGIFVFSTEHPINTSAQGIHPPGIKRRAT